MAHDPELTMKCGWTEGDVNGPVRAAGPRGGYMPQCRSCNKSMEWNVSENSRRAGLEATATGCEVMEPRDEHGGNSVSGWVGSGH